MTATTTVRQRPGGDHRGSAAQRRQSKRWLLGAVEDRRLGWAPYGGDGEHVDCAHCGCQLDFQSVERDRIVPGGSYARENLQPSCRRCNASRSNRRVAGAVAR